MHYKNKFVKANLFKRFYDIVCNVNGISCIDGWATSDVGFVLDFQHLGC